VLLLSIWANIRIGLDEIVALLAKCQRVSPPDHSNLKRGILGELLVATGDTVDERQILARLQGTQYVAQVNDLQ